MKRSFSITLFTLLVFSLSSCKGQTVKAPVASDQGLDYKAAVDYGLPKNIDAEDYSPAWEEAGQKILLTGIVYQRDGKTPAPNILLYYYQTNMEGKYLHKEEENRSMLPNSLGQTHGYIRGWVKTDKDGKYAIYTIRPGTYPSRAEAAHVHVTLKDPKVKEAYYIDNFVFDDDPLLNTKKRKSLENRGGSGVLRLLQKGDLQIGERNIILGLNIPNYPSLSTTEISSGPNIGEDVFSFTPYHAWGPDQGTETCPICKYGWYHGILYFVGNKPNWPEINQWLRYLESEAIKREQYLKVYFVYGNEEGYSAEKRIATLAAIGRELQLKKTALTFVPSFADTNSEINLNELNPNVENTFLIYRRRNIIDKYINLKPSKENLTLILERLDASRNDLFDLPSIKIE